MALTWQKSNGEWVATQDGRTVFSIEKRRGGYGLRRWSVRRDGTPDMAGVEIVKSIKEAKDYAATLTKPARSLGRIIYGPAGWWEYES